ncbi:G-protein coupled receptor Mth [Orchesella cincta]|uniref:G-protein coupled receptor Mth n=1 Tax=Orchesella cincta TaxID=48709 RepID=A0A1D2MZJ1_ORCCI|nr:G-protein coupled receptor Mth [Orchesella cincta]
MSLPHDEDPVTVKTCCEQPLTENNVTWCDGMYSLSENVHFLYGDLKCPGETIFNGSVHLGSAVEGDTRSGFYPQYFLKYDERFYSTEDYCFSSMSEDRIDVKICKPDCPRSKLCLPKCCNLWDDVSFQNDTHFCMPSLEDWVWKPEIFEDDGYFYRRKDAELKRIHFFVQDPSRTPNCTVVRLINYQQFDFKILNSGEIVWTSPDVLDWYRVPEGRVCVDREFEEDNGKGNIILIGCLEDFIPTITENLTLIDTINFILTQISLGFLALTLIIYLMLSRQHSVHGWTHFSYFTALWSNLLLASVIYWNTPSFNLEVAKEGPRQTLGALCFMASVLSSFFHNATNTTRIALSVDIFRMFHSIFKQEEDRVTKADLSKFQWAAWSISFVMIFIGLALTYTQGTLGGPRYGYTNCEAKYWTGDELLEGFSHLLTVILFLVTLLRICRAQIQGTYKEMERSATKRVYKKAKNIFFKLLFVMAITWLSLVLNYVLVKSADPIVKWFYTLAEFIISLQGFVIFLMFGVNRRNLDLLGENYTILRRLSSIIPITSDIPGPPADIQLKSASLSEK